MRNYVERMKSEIVDHGEYIQISNSRFIFKRCVTGVYVDRDERYSLYRVRIATLSPSLTASLYNLTSEVDAIEICKYLMDTCCKDTTQQI